MKTKMKMKSIWCNEDEMGFLSTFSSIHQGSLQMYIPYPRQSGVREDLRP